MRNDLRVYLPPRVNEPYLRFYNNEDGTIINSIWQCLEQGMWQELNIENFLFNSSLPSCYLNQEKPLFPFIQQIQPGTQLDSKTGALRLNQYTPQYREWSWDSFLSICNDYFLSLGAKQIGVHLSGGFDSSLIMCILKKLQIPFIAIGMKSDTYEFRSERKVQDTLLNYASGGELISFQDHPFYSKLAEVPKHQIPDSHIKSYSSAMAMAKAFHKHGCDVVLSGQGGDSLFVNEIESLCNTKFNIADEFENYPEQYRFYEKQDIRLASFFAHKPIIDIICSARIGKSDDSLKRWARNWFREILPSELTDFTYCADYFGLSMSGLEQAKPTISDLMNEAYQYTGYHLFNSKNIKRFINQDVYSFEYNDYIKYCSLISVAVWYHSLFRKDE